MTNEMPETIWAYIYNEQNGEKLYNAADWKSDIIEETQYTRGKPVDFERFRVKLTGEASDIVARLAVNMFLDHLKDNGYRIVR